MRCCRLAELRAAEEARLAAERAEQERLRLEEEARLVSNPALKQSNTAVNVNAA